MRTDLSLRIAGMALALLAGCSVALACGERIAKRGGQVNDDQGEMNFEMVHRARNVVFYLEDHGQPVTTQGATARLEIRRGSTGWSATLRPDGENRFVGSLPSSLVLGDAVEVDVKFPNGSIANGRFSYGMKPKPERPTFSFTSAMRQATP
jgi:hypothetical protein